MQLTQIRPVGPCPARIMIVSEYPGESELAFGEAMRGYSGKELVKMLAEAGVQFSQCFTTTAVHARPPRNDSSYFIARAKKHITPQHVQFHKSWVLPVVAQSAQLLAREIEQCRPNVIIALGDMALFLLTGEKSVTKWRGSELPLAPGLNCAHEGTVVPTWAPGMLFKKWDWRPVAVQDLRRAARLQHKSGFNPPKYNFLLQQNYSTTAAYLYSMLDRCQSATPDTPYKLAVDIETRAGHIACVGIAWSARDAICIPLMCVERPSGYWTLDQEAHIVDLLRQVLTHPNCMVVGQNFTYDIQYFYRHFMWMPNLRHDTMLGQHVLFAGMKKSLDFQASMYCSSYRYWKDEGKEWEKTMPEVQLWQYNCMDAVATYEIDDVQQGLVDRMGFREVYNFQQELFWPVTHTMNRGLRVDHARKGELAYELLQAIDAHKQWLYEVLGYELNVGSSVQMQDLFYQQFGQKPIKDPKTRQPTTNSAALQQLAEREPLLRPLYDHIDDLRSLYVFLRTFVNAQEDQDGRCRCSYNISGAETYRFSSGKNAFGSGLNLQNIPKGGKLRCSDMPLPNVRKLYLPDPGMEFFDIDLSAADLRIVVWESDCREMKQMLRAGLDPYTEIAKEFYHDSTINKKDPRRQTFKSVAHGTNYLGTAKGLATRLGLSIHELEKTQKWYFGKFPEIKKWQDHLIAQVTTRRFVSNVFGYKFFFMDRIEGTVFNQAVAWIPQSTVARVINSGYMNLHKNHPEIEVLLQVHDSLGGQYPIDGAERHKQTVLDACAIELPYADPLVIPVGIATSRNSWGECK